MLLLGRRRARMRPRAFGAYERFAEGKTLMRGGFTPPAQIKSLGVPQNGRFCGQGGMRASMYNAMPTEGVEKLCDFIRAFDKNN